jgi:heat shock protein HslJ
MMAALLVATGCGEGEGAVRDPLEGSKWEMTSLRDGEVLRAANPTTIATAVFTAGNASGFDGCNHYRVSYAVDRDAISFGEPVQTGSACDPEYAGGGDLFMTALLAADRLVLGAGSLELSDSAGAVLVVFRPAEDLPLTDVTWLLTGFAGSNGGLVSPLTGTQISLWFRTDGTLGGVAGCNDYAAEYRLDGSAVLIEAVVQTEMACLEPDGVMAQETGYLAALGRVVGFSTTLTTLELLDEDGGPVAEYRFSGRIR